MDPEEQQDHEEDASEDCELGNARVSMLVPRCGWGRASAPCMRRGAPWAACRRAIGYQNVHPITCDTALCSRRATLPPRMQAAGVRGSGVDGRADARGAWRLDWLFSRLLDTASGWCEVKRGGGRRLAAAL